MLKVYTRVMPTITVLLYEKKKITIGPKLELTVEAWFTDTYAPVDVSLIVCSWNVRFGAVGGDRGFKSSVMLILKHNTQKQEANTTFLDHIKIQQ